MSLVLCIFLFPQRRRPNGIACPIAVSGNFLKLVVYNPIFCVFSFLSAKKVEEDTGDYHIDRVSTDFCRALAEARRNKGMTQAQLAQAINEKPSVVSEYESGKVSKEGDGWARSQAIAVWKHTPCIAW